MSVFLQYVLLGICQPLLMINITFLSFSDQEPPYSMMTLHEMAETGIRLALKRGA